MLYGHVAVPLSSAGKRGHPSCCDNMLPFILIFFYFIRNMLVFWVNKCFYIEQVPGVLLRQQMIQMRKKLITTL